MLGYPDIRLAQPEERPALLRLTPLIHQEVGLLSYSDAKVHAIIDRALNRKDGFLGISGTPDNISGCVCLTLGQMEYSDDWLIMELWNFVRPEVRNTNLGQQLINFAKDISCKMNMKMLIGVLNNVRTEAKIRLYDRSFPRVGAFYIFDPAQAGEPGNRELATTSRSAERKLAGFAREMGCAVTDIVPHTIYVPRKTEQKLVEAARRRGVSLRDLIYTKIVGDAEIA